MIYFDHTLPLSLNLHSRCSVPLPNSSFYLTSTVNIVLPFEGALLLARYL